MGRFLKNGLKNYMLIFNIYKMGLPQLNLLMDFSTVMINEIKYG
jgi:hypothetical protein